MEAHTEVPDAGSWSLIELSLLRKKKAKVLYFRRALYTTAAVAASLVLLLVLNKSSYDFNDSAKVVVQKSAIANLEPEQDIIEKKSVQSIDNSKTLISEQISEQIKSEKQTINPDKLIIKEQSTDKEQTTIKEQSTDKKQAIIEKQAEQNSESSKSEKNVESAKKDSRSSYPPVQDYKSISRKKHSPIVAIATNLSPSTGNNSVSLMSMSQSQGGLAPNNVVSTIQKASVPQEVISNTKFLMPVSMGIQLQMPISKMFAVGVGVNYTLLFSQYDALSHQETRETEQTLHYIGVPLNLYVNIMQKDNIRLYATGGIALEKGLYAFYRVSENGVGRTSGETIDGLQWSLTGGFGVEFAINNSKGLYFDPTVAYYFDNSQPLSIRTSQPLQFKFELGFRFHL